MYISQIKLRNWKNFKDAEAALGMRAFLIGPNASGKSNLLDALRFLRDVANDGLERAVGARDGVSAIRCLAATRYSNVDVEVTLNEGGNALWRYRLSINQDNVQRPVVREEVVYTAMETAVLNRPDAEDERDPLRLTQTALEQVSENQPFREVAGFFKSISYQHLLPQVVRDPRGFSPLPVQNDPYGRDFLLRLWRTPTKTRDSRLRKIAGALRSAIPQLTELQVELDGSAIPHLIGGYAHWRPHAARQNESQFSDGTLRLLGLLWTVYEGSGPLLLEEPEISLHPEIVRRLPTVFYRINRSRPEPRQLIISTHSEDLLRDEGIAPDEVLRLEPGPDGTLLFPPDESDRRAMAAGLAAADVLMPRAAPEGIRQLPLQFEP